MDFQFSNKDTAAGYESIFGVDKKITVQGLYWGKLSDITPEVADRLIALGDNQVRRKLTAATGDDKTAKSKTEKP